MHAQAPALSRPNPKGHDPSWADPGAALAVTFRGKLRLVPERRLKLGLDGAMEAVYALREASGMHERDMQRGLSWMRSRPRHARTADGTVLEVLLPDDLVSVAAKRRLSPRISPDFVFFDMPVKWLCEDTGELPFDELPVAGDGVVWVSPDPGERVRPAD